MEHPHVIVGAGPAGAAAARVLAERGQRVLLLGDEPDPPYDRTVLTKSALTGGDLDLPALWPREAEWLGLIDHRPDTVVVALDPDARTITTAQGETIAYAACLLATGAAPLALADVPDAHVVRTASDVRGLREAVDEGPRRVLVIGGGVVGLEAAASLRTLGHRVEVVEAGPRILGRGVPAPVAQWLHDLHEAHGVSIRTSTAVHPGTGTGIAGATGTGNGSGAAAGTGTGIAAGSGSGMGTGMGADRSAGGEHSAYATDAGTDVQRSAGGEHTAYATDADAADVVIVGIGVTPRTALAEAAGIHCDDGIVTDASGRTSAAGVFAAGDCARWDGVRLESYIAAGEQGAVAGAVMAGEEGAAWSVLASHWSDQYDATLQSVGTPPADAEEVVCRGEGFVLVLSFAAGDPGRLVAACGVSHGPVIARPVRAAEHLLRAGGRVDREALQPVLDEGDLRALAAFLRSATR